MRAWVWGPLPEHSSASPGLTTAQGPTPRVLTHTSWLTDVAALLEQGTRPSPQVRGHAGVWGDREPAPRGTAARGC